MATLNATTINGSLTTTGTINGAAITTSTNPDTEATTTSISNLKILPTVIDSTNVCIISNISAIDFIDKTEATNTQARITTKGQINAGYFNAYSDARLKENFEPLTIEKSILDLPTYKFDFIHGARNQIGCKAQDLQEICPEIVSKDSDGMLTIQESKIVYLLLEEVKKLREELNELKGI